MAINLSCEIKAKYNYKKVEEIKKKLPQTIKEGIEEVLKNIQGSAIRLEKGHNEDGIICEMVDTSNNNIKGRVLADVKAFPFFMFEHFGTGQFAEMEHIGKTKHFIESGFTEWFIPVNKAPRKLPYPIITINDMQFYIAHGVKANHFMTDAEFETRNDNLDVVQKNIYEMLKEACK